MLAVRALKERFPDLLFVGAGYSYLQQFLPHVAQAAVRGGRVDSVGLGRMVLSYPALPLDVLGGRGLRRKLVCRTFSDCTTAPRNGLPSGCYRARLLFWCVVVPLTGPSCGDASAVSRRPIQSPGLSFSS